MTHVRSLVCLLLSLLVASPSHAQVLSPASTLPIAGPIAYNFYDTFSGTLALVSGRTPDTVSNGSTWVGTGANAANYEAGGGALYATAGSGVAYAVMHTTCGAAPQEVGGTFTYSGATGTPTIASILNYVTYGFNDMVHPNISTGASLTQTTGLWSSNPPNASNFTGQLAQWASPLTGQGSTSANTAYNYRVFINNYQVTTRVELASTGAVVGEWQSMDPLVPSLDGPDVFFEVGDTTTKWTAAWARCASASNTQTTMKIPGGISGTPIGSNGDMADGAFLSIVAGYSPTIGSTMFRGGSSQIFVPNAKPLQVVGQATSGIMQIGSDTSGYPGELDFFNGASFPTGATQGKTAIVEDGSYNFSFTTNSIQWLKYVYNGLPAMVVPWTLAGPYSAAGTVIPACSSTYKGSMAYVTDATTPTLNATYVSGGAVIGPVFCNGTNWVTEF